MKSIWKIDTADEKRLIVIVTLSLMIIAVIILWIGVTTDIVRSVLYDVLATYVAMALLLIFYLIAKIKG